MIYTLFNNHKTATYPNLHAYQNHLVCLSKLQNPELILAITSQLGAVLPSGKYLAICGDIFVVILGKCYWHLWVEAMDAVKLKMHRTDPHSSDLSGPKCQYHQNWEILIWKFWFLWLAMGSRNVYFCPEIQVILIKSLRA